jgi:hypothetical protein
MSECPRSRKSIDWDAGGLCLSSWRPRPLTPVVVSMLETTATDKDGRRGVRTNTAKALSDCAGHFRPKSAGDGKRSGRTSTGMSADEFQVQAMSLQNEFAIAQRRCVRSRQSSSEIGKNYRAPGHRWPERTGARRCGKIAIVDPMFSTNFRLRMGADSPHSQDRERPVNCLLTIQPDHA